MRKTRIRPWSKKNRRRCIHYCVVRTYSSSFSSVARFIITIIDDFIRDNYVIFLLASRQFIKAINMGGTGRFTRGRSTEPRRVIFEI
ncbi:hypothetical protein TcasGA2_TC001675 [Tribolium castaneum]|uniref:Uncharacterized protein n=1 Tax=Tribolium castaneum TaxID=7070 RepID=D6X1K9_TRICA|nr:hypothetical protein TcasGA2_TC001675 [Tribolium castaneum]